MTIPRVKCKGFESAFIKSYSGWELIDTAVFGFYDVEFQEGFLPDGFVVPEESYVNFDLESLKVSVYGNEPEPVFERNFRLVAF